MAKIVLSADAPDDAKTFSLGNDVFDVPTESTDPVLLANAASHPWLEVEANEEAAEARYRETGVDPEKDPLSASNPAAALAFDPDAIKAVEDAKETEIEPVAIDAGKDQDRKGRAKQPVASTIAAADADVSKTTIAGDDS